MQLSELNLPKSMAFSDLLMEFRLKLEEIKLSRELLS